MSPEPRVLVFTWTDLAKPSGSPAILCEVLRWLPPESTEVVCESDELSNERRDVDLPHKITRLGLHRLLWPFPRGARAKQIAQYLSAPLLTAWGLWKVHRYKPDCLLTVYYGDRWILAAYLISKLSRVPVVYYVHDPFLEPAVYSGGLRAPIARWLEPRSLRHGRVAVLCELLGEHYRTRYGISPTVVRHLLPRPPIERPAQAGEPGGLRRLGFAGTIYDNNRALMTQLVAAVRANPRLRLKIWSNARPAVLRDLQIEGDRIEIAFEPAYDRLLEQLSTCDLLYLPLAFGDTPTLPSDSLRYALPTKALDYLLTGAPILVNAAPGYEVTEFFRSSGAAHLLDTNAPGALEAWLGRWLAGQVPTPTVQQREAALARFSAPRNFARLHGLLSGQPASALADRQEGQEA